MTQNERAPTSLSFNSVTQEHSTVMHYRFPFISAALLAVVPMMSTQAAQYTKQEQANIAVVQAFYAATAARRAAGGESMMPFRPIAEMYIAENYHQNSPGWAAEGQGREAFIKIFEGRGGGPGGMQPPAPSDPADAARAGGAPAERATASKPAQQAVKQDTKVRYIGAQGNIIVRVSGDGSSDLVFNMFRVENGKIAEHWDAFMVSGLPGGEGRATGAAGASGSAPAASGG